MSNVGYENNYRLYPCSVCGGRFDGAHYCTGKPRGGLPKRTPLRATPSPITLILERDAALKKAEKWKKKYKKLKAKAKGNTK